MAAVLYAIACAAPPARDLVQLVDLAQARGFLVCAIATPMALRFVDVATLEARTGYPVRSDYKLPGTPDVLPPADAMIVAPATFNTINKWAAGISDTLALGLLCEALGLELPIVALPFLNAAQARHPAFEPSVAKLRNAGVTVIYGGCMPPPHPPGTGSARLGDYPWHLALDALSR
ncbi:MAG: flavoprotein [Egibacteraceae bacterium]